MHAVQKWPAVWCGPHLIFAFSDLAGWPVFDHLHIAQKIAIRKDNVASIVLLNASIVQRLFADAARLHISLYRRPIIDNAVLRLVILLILATDL